MNDEALFDRLPHVYVRNIQLSVAIRQATRLSPKSLADLILLLEQNIRYLASEGIMLPNEVEQLIDLIRRVKNGISNCSPVEIKMLESEKAVLRGQLHLLIERINISKY